MESLKSKSDAESIHEDATPVKRKESSLRERLQRSVKSSSSKKRSSNSSPKPSPGPSRPSSTPSVTPDVSRLAATPSRVSKLPEISEVTSTRPPDSSSKPSSSKIPKFRFSK